jgi:arsenate reductase-like glutaredoxin family protein
MQITMYASTTCTTCAGLGKWLTKSGFEYTKKMIDDDQATMTEFFEISDNFVGVPFSVLTHEDGSVTKIPGYDRKAFQQALGLK